MADRDGGTGVPDGESLILYLSVERAEEIVGAAYIRTAVDPDTVCCVMMRKRYPMIASMTLTSLPASEVISRIFANKAGGEVITHHYRLRFTSMEDLIWFKLKMT